MTSLNGRETKRKRPQQPNHEHQPQTVPRTIPPHRPQHPQAGIHLTHPGVPGDGYNQPRNRNHNLPTLQMKPENDYRKLSREWLRYDGHSNLLLASILAFLAMQGSMWAYWTASHGKWIFAALLAAGSGVAWHQTYLAARHAAKCLGSAKK